MWSYRFRSIGRSAKRGSVSYSFHHESVINPKALVCFHFSALPLFQSRLYSSDSVPKITTHYTIVPRETDARWKGILKDDISAFQRSFQIVDFYLRNCMHAYEAF